MAYFPMFMDMKGMKVLVVGGGNIAAEKIEKLLDFTTDITVISETINPEVEKLITRDALSYRVSTYAPGDVKGYDIVVVATDTPALHQAIYEETREHRILVNSVDNIEYCDFIFPSYLKREDLTVAFSTSGASPAFAKHLRAYCERIIPENVGAFLTKMKNLRATMPKGKARMAYFEKMVGEYFQTFEDKK